MVDLGQGLTISGLGGRFGFRLHCGTQCQPVALPGHRFAVGVWRGVGQLELVDLGILKKLGREDIMVVAGGVIPPKDYDYLYEAGVAGVFGPGTVISKCAKDILEKLLKQE